ITVMISGFFWMLFLFVMVSSAADDFFSPSVSSIVAHLRISESIAYFYCNTLTDGSVLVCEKT
ncbi:hypothetical protein DICVIV_14191, partial [Dictyocaulus viviparus]